MVSNSFLKEKNHNDFGNKLKEFNDVWESYAHEKAQSSSDVIQESERISFGDLTYIQKAEDTESECKI